jgi:hypothetical protein
MYKGDVWNIGKVSNSSGHWPYSQTLRLAGKGWQEKNTSFFDDKFRRIEVLQHWFQMLMQTNFCSLSASLR